MFKKTTQIILMFIILWGSVVHAELIGGYPASDYISSKAYFFGNAQTPKIMDQLKADLPKDLFELLLKAFESRGFSQAVLKETKGQIPIFNSIPKQNYFNFYYQDKLIKVDFIALTTKSGDPQDQPTDINPPPFAAVSGFVITQMTIATTTETSGSSVQKKGIIEYGWCHLSNLFSSSDPDEWYENNNDCEDIIIEVDDPNACLPGGSVSCIISATDPNYVPCCEGYTCKIIQDSNGSYNKCEKVTQNNNNSTWWWF